MRSRLYLVAAACLLGALACEESKPQAEPTAEKASESPDSPTKTNTAARAASAQPDQPAALAKKPNPAPPSKAFKEASDLGLLPDGVGLAVGASVPALSAKDADDKSVELAELTQAGDVLVMFYRGGWCPYCNFQVRAMTDAFPKFQQLGITPVLVSVDKISEAAKTKANYEVPFPILSDPDLAWHKAFKVLEKLSPEMVDKLKGYKIDVEAASGRDHHTIAVPSVFLIRKGGKIAFAHADRDYKVRPGATALVEALKQAQQAH